MTVCPGGKDHERFHGVFGAVYGCLACQCEALAAEVERLKRGDFTEEEFQNLCHNFSEDDVCRFKQGCEEYQRKLFGDKV